MSGWRVCCKVTAPCDVHRDAQHQELARIAPNLHWEVPATVEGSPS